ncbi:MAG: hypothetical protein ACYC9W_06085 [Candidatus Limnocylindria bacterium]
MATRDPDGPQTVGIVVAGSALAIGALASVAFIWLATRHTSRGARRAAATARGLRRGAIVGCLVALLAGLRVLDGLTPLTALFVAAPFLVAEAVLSTRRV